MTGTRARLAASAIHLPPWQPMAEREKKIRDSGGSYAPPAGLIEDLTGVRGAHARNPSSQVSDLAVTAANKAMAEAGTAPDELDLLLFASCTQDMIEPATAHIVAAKLGATCPVFDVKNACNSVLNAMEVAGSFIEAGRYRTVLITCGECPTDSVRWRLPDHTTFLKSLPGYTLSDAGAAMLLTAGPSDAAAPGILRSAFGAQSSAWDACTVVGGGSVCMRPTPDGPEGYIQLKGRELIDAGVASAPTALSRAAEELEIARSCSFIGIHQISQAQFHLACEVLDFPEERCMLFVTEHGNCASASLPLQLCAAQESGRAGSGDLVALVGLGSGISAGVMILRL